MRLPPPIPTVTPALLKDHSGPILKDTSGEAMMTPYGRILTGRRIIFMPDSAYLPARPLIKGEENPLRSN